MKPTRHYTPLDHFCLNIDQGLRAVFGKPETTDRPLPDADLEESELSQQEKRHAAGLMRVNHAGEVCAQALYHGQGVVSRDRAIQAQMRKAAIEEGDHLAWCSRRVTELGSHTSYLNPLWYLGSFAIGLTAGLVGDRWSLGFVAETERQVVNHLDAHLSLLPDQDLKSRKILEQMQADEAQHREEAIAAGAAQLPDFVKKIMTLTSRLMVKAAYWI